MRSFPDFIAQRTGEFAFRIQPVSNPGKEWVVNFMNRVDLTHIQPINVDKIVCGLIRHGLTVSWDYSEPAGSRPLEVSS